MALLEKAALELYSGTRGLSTVRGSNPKMGKRNVSVDCRQSADAACTGQAVRRSRSTVPNRTVTWKLGLSPHMPHEISPAARGSLHRQGDILARNTEGLTNT